MTKTLRELMEEDRLKREHKKEEKAKKKAEKMAKYYPFGNKVFTCTYMLKGLVYTGTIEMTSKPKNYKDYTKLNSMFIYSYWVNQILAKHNRRLLCGELKKNDVFILSVTMREVN